MTNDEANNHYYFAVKNLSELNSLGWLRGKKETIISGDNDFRNALNDALNYQNIDKYNWKGIDFPAGSKDWKKFERNNKKIALNILFISHNTKKKGCCI